MMSVYYFEWYQQLQLRANQTIFWLMLLCFVWLVALLALLKPDIVLNQRLSSINKDALFAMHSLCCHV